MRPLRPLSTVALLGLLAAGCGGGDGPTPPDGDGSGATPQLADLSVGELQSHPPRQDGLALALPGESGPASYLVIAQGTSRSPGFLSLRLSVSGGTETSAAGSRSAAASRVSPLTSGVLREARLRMRSDRLVRRIRENARRELDLVNARPARRTAATGPGVSRSSLLPSGEVPETGDTLRVWLGVESDLSVTCDTTKADTVTSVVRSVGREVAILADTAIADPAMQEMDWASLADEYDQSVLGVPEAYFGEATDIDDNQRVLVLFTPEVNKLTERDSDTRIGGFFIPSDLADSGDPGKSGTRAGGVCPAGNEAEIVYLLAPDPTGEFSDSVSVETARRSGIGASPGEFEHLINAGNRVIDQSGDFNDLETTWLDEGLSHLAEEVVGLKRAGLPVRDNLTLKEAITDSTQLKAFNTFHIQNFLRMRRYLINPDSTQALAAEDPQDVESLEMRGFAYLFLRWLGDQEGPAGSGIVDGSNEQQLFRQLARGSGQLLTGIDNIEASTGKDWKALLADYTGSPAADDQVETDPRLQVKTWDLPAVFEALHENEGTRSAFPEERFPPLEVADLGSPVGDTARIEVQAGGARYFRVSAPSGDTLTVRLTDPAGSPLGPDSAARLLLFRVR